MFELHATHLHRNATSTCIAMLVGNVLVVLLSGMLPISVVVQKEARPVGEYRRMLKFPFPPGRVRWTGSPRNVLCSSAAGLPHPARLHGQVWCANTGSRHGAYRLLSLRALPLS